MWQARCLRVVYTSGGFSNILGRARVQLYAEYGAMIVSPCFHPGRHCHMGDTTEKGQEIFKLVSALAEYAMEKMAMSFMDHPHLDRKTRCLEDMVDNEHTDFGKAFATAIRYYNVATEAFQVGVLISKAAPDLLLAPKGLLAKKQALSRKGRIAAAERPTDSSTGYELLIQKRIVTGPKGDNSQFSLSWVEKDEVEWLLAPVILPEHVEGSGGGVNDKRFLHL
jgi:hypothetical protein